jgi:hypothetical protein
MPGSASSGPKPNCEVDVMGQIQMQRRKIS